MADSESKREIKELRVTVDRELCCAYKNCITEAPGAFRLGDDDIVTFNELPETESREAIIEACRACPVAALAVTDAEGNDLLA